MRDDRAVRESMADRTPRSRKMIIEITGAPGGWRWHAESRDGLDRLGGIVDCATEAEALAAAQSELSRRGLPL